MSGRFATWLAAAGCALTLAGCGGGTEATPSESTIPAPIAEDLATRSEEIAATLEGGDVCGAAKQADELNDAVNDAMAEGQIPKALQEELQNVVAELVNGVNCEQPEEEEENGKGKGKDKDKDKDEDESAPTTTTIVLETTTE